VAVNGFFNEAGRGGVGQNPTHTAPLPSLVVVGIDGTSNLLVVVSVKVGGRGGDVCFFFSFLKLS
jgi:hypothetical protein